MSESRPWYHAESALVALARNLASRYVLIAVNILIGMVMLRYNMRELGVEIYGLWMLAASVTAYFTVLDMGYGSAVVRFVAEFRTRRDARALNETLSTMFCVFSGLGILCCLLAIGVAAALPLLFNLPPGQEDTGRWVLLMVALQVALYFPFSVYGGVINGFERYYINNLVGIAFNIATALVNVLVLQLGHGLVELVAATTVMRIAPFWVYRLNAHRTFPELRISPRLFRSDRLRTLTSFSIYVAAIDWSARLSYTTGAIYLGAFLNTAAVAVYVVAQRLADALVTTTQQLHTLLFPAIVRRAVAGDTASQQSLLIKAARFQLAVAMCLCGTVAALAGPVITLWIDEPSMAPEELLLSVRVAELLLVVVVLRAWIAMPSTLLKGSGHHSYLARVATAGAVANLLLSIPLVKGWGPIGAALGMAFPTAVMSGAFIFPRACRVVGLPVSHGYRAVVWPALWPALLTVAGLLVIRQVVPLGIVAVLLELAGGAAIYAVLFLSFGLSREERRWLKSAAVHVWQRRSAGLAAA